MSTTIVEAVSRLVEIERTLQMELTATFDAAARVIELRARQEIGHYQAASGRFAAWPRLAKRTLEEKRRRGYAPPDHPLLRTGKLRAGIRYRVRDAGAEPLRLTAEIGANGVVAAVQELGGKHVPARSYLRRAAAGTEKDVVAACGQALKAAFGIHRGAPRRLG